MKRRRTGGVSPQNTVRLLVGWGLVRVAGRSMEPTLFDGDVLLVRRPRTPRPGVLAVVRLPEPRPTAVKRLLRQEPGGWWVERDNPKEGVDSWAVGAIATEDVIAQVVARIWPIRRG